MALGRQPADRVRHLEFCGQRAALVQERPGADESRMSYHDPGLVPKSPIWYEPRGAVIENPAITTPEGEAAFQAKPVTPKELLKASSTAKK